MIKYIGIAKNKFSNVLGNTINPSESLIGKGVPKKFSKITRLKDSESSETMKDRINGYFNNTILNKTR